MKEKEKEDDEEEETIWILSPIAIRIKTSW